MSTLTTTPTTDALAPSSPIRPDAAGVSRRAVKRAGIAELNDLDLDSVRERFLQSRYDDRPSWVKALDLLDSGRNAVLSTLAPSLEQKARERGETGAGGVGKVFGSDVLEAAGIHNRIIQHLGGFAIDLITDPLTYIGPAGWGFKVTSKTGQAVRVGLRGRKVIGDALEAVKAGGLGAVKDAETSRLFTSAAAGLAEAPASNEELAARLSSRVLGPVTSGRTGRALSRVGGEVEHGGGMLAELVDQFGHAEPLINDQAEAVRGWLAKYSAGTGKGLRLGRDAEGKLRFTTGAFTAGDPVATSTVAHIPFTDWGIHVPAFTGEGKAAGDILRIATATGGTEPVRALGPTLAMATPFVRRMQDMEIMARSGEVVTPQEWDEVRDGLGRIMARRAQEPVEAAAPSGIGELLALQRVTDEADAAHALASVRANAAGNPLADYAQSVHEAMGNYANSVRGSIKQFATTQDEATQRIVNRMLGVDDDRIGASLLTPFRTVARALNAPGVVLQTLDSVDRVGKEILGQPVGLVREYTRAIRNGLLPGAREAYSSMERQVRGAVVSAMRDAGLDASNLEDYRKAQQVLLAHMFDVRNKAAIADKGEPVFYVKKFGSDEDAEWVRLLSKAQESGFFSKRPGGSLSDRLRGIAQQNAGMLDTMGSFERADDLLGIPIEGYVPNVPTPAATSEIRKTRNQQILRGTGGAPSGSAIGEMKEAFQKPRSTEQVRWISGDGSAKRIFRKDLWAADLSDERWSQIAREAPDDAAELERLRTDAKEYLRLSGDKEWAAKHPFKQTDPWEINELHRGGHFHLILGSEPLPDGFMDLNAATIMAARTMAHERAVSRREWLKFVRQFGVAVDPARLTGLRREGGELVLKDGSVAKFYQNQSGEWGFEQLGQRYRPLKQSVQGLKDNPIIEGMGDTVALAYHEDVARAIEDVAQMYSDPHVLLKGLDTLTGLWKSATLAHPSWFVGNVIGDTINQLTNGAKIEHMVSDAPAVARILRHANEPEVLKTLSIEGVRGQTIRGDQLINDLREAGLLGSNAFAETVLQLYARKHFILPSLVSGAEGRGFTGAFRPSALRADFLERLSHEAAANRVAGGAKAAAFVARDRFVRNVLRPWFKFNERSNDYIKALAYLSFLRQGSDMPAAVQRTIRAGFDYADSTRVERDWFKRLWPFYSFMRLNGAYQIKTLLNRPIFIGSFPILQHAVEGALDGDEALPLHARPQWMRQQLAIQVGSDPKERFGLLLGNLLPQEQGFAALSAARGVLTGDQQAMQDAAKYLVGGLNPAIRTPLEIGAGKEFFSDRTIGGDALAADLTPAQAITNQVRPVREVPRLAETFREQGAGAGAARAVLGGRVQPMSDDRIRLSRLREFKDREQRIHIALRRADRKGDTKERMAANLALLELYRAMDQSGLGDEVPKWAAARLRRLAQPTSPQ